MACRTGCKTRDHESYGACLRAGALRVAYCNSASGRDATAQRQWDRDLALYKDARAQGIQPSSTKRDSVERALRISDKTGKAYDAGVQG